MKTKKITAALLAITMLAGMTACSSDSGNVASVNPSENATESVTTEISPTETSAVEDTTTQTETEAPAETEAVTEETTAAATAEEPSDLTRTKGTYYTYTDEVNFDLNSDGENEIISYAITTEEDFEYSEIFVNDSTYQMYFPTEYYLICDIDPTDKYFEIALSSTGMSGDYGTEFLRYDNGELYSIGNVSDTVDGTAEYNFSLVDSFGKSLTINGDGTVTAAKRLSIFQSWYAYSTYKLNTDTNKLEETQNIFYPYGEALKDDYNSVSSKIYDDVWPASYTSKAIGLYSQPDTTSSAVTFEPQKFAATATDNQNWVYLVGETGVSGWLYYENNNSYDETGAILEFGNNAYIDASTGERYIDGFNEEGTYYTDIFCSLLMYD